MSDVDIFNHVKDTVEKYRNAIDLKQFNSNLIDPIKLTFDAKVYGKTFKQIIEEECFRQIDKANTNHVGYFHQNIFKYAKRGWKVPKQGFDVVNDKLHIYAELKNKHNTMNAASSGRTYIKMQNKILQDDSAICYLVEVISRKSQNSNWCISVDKKQYSHNRIRRISIDRFYELVFGDAEAFFKLCKALPNILDDVISDTDFKKLENTVFDELSQHSPDLLRSLYLLAFETYCGFSQLKV
jgi:hypothetical protein